MARKTKRQPRIETQDVEVEYHDVAVQDPDERLLEMLRDLPEDRRDQVMRAVVDEAALAKLKADAEREEAARVKQARDLAAKRFWPQRRSLPRVHIKRAAMPCHKCRRVLMDNLSQACVVATITTTVAYYRCRGCGHRFKLPIEEV